MRPSARAAVGVVTVGVDVHATLGVGVVAGDVVGDGGLGTLRSLLEGHGALDIAVSTEDGDCSILRSAGASVNFQVAKRGGGDGCEEPSRWKGLVGAAGLLLRLDSSEG